VAPPAKPARNLTVDQVPFLPGVRETYLKTEPTVIRTPLQAIGRAADVSHAVWDRSARPAETNRVIFLGVGAPHSWRIVYTDGREHPKNLTPSWYGHSVGRWEGDTLVVDSVGFNERFWLTREGVPHTSKVHLTERISRPNFDQLRYEATIDDPGAYSAPWSGGWHLRWSAGNEPFDYLCQENNRDPARMIGAE
jgi:hypothetical protein